jgi:prepilin-type N-terminal cleavage/methylation domain-containing protein
MKAVASRRQAADPEMNKMAVIVRRKRVPYSVLLDESGFTLLEMLVALVILAVGILGVLHVFSTSIQASKAAESYSVAATLAQQVAARLEREMNLEAGEMSGEFDEFPGYAYDCEIQAPNSNGLIPVMITVGWHVGSAVKFFSMTTYVQPPPSSSSGSSTTSGTAPAVGGGTTK